MSTLCSKGKPFHKFMANIKRLGPSYNSKKSERTRGIEVRLLVQDNIRVSVWDMAGQQEFHAFHDHMFPDTGANFGNPSIFMFVWSPINSKNHKDGECKEAFAFEASFRYWLKFIASKTRQSNMTSKLIVVLTRKDQMDFLRDALAGSIHTLSTSFSRLVDVVEVFEVDARSSSSVNPVVSCIFKLARALLNGVEIYHICNTVSQYLTQVLDTMPPIISWKLFSSICDNQFKVSDVEIQKAIAFSLNESGDIIYLNSLLYIVLKPNWFCQEVMGSLIDFNEQSHMSRIMPICGYAKQDYLEKLLAKSSQSEVSGAVLVELMEGMHLCCKVPNDPQGTVLIPATLPLTSDPLDIKNRLQWRGVIYGPSQKLAYVGRRLECDQKDLTFLTPGLFPIIQVIFNKAFGDIEADVKLHRDVLSICIRDIEILVNFGLDKGEHVIDVIMRAPLLAMVGGTLTNVKEEIVGTLIRVCAQPVGNQGVKLVECVIRPDCVLGPSPPHEREDQCASLQYLKQGLMRNLEQGRKPEELKYLWKESEYFQPVAHTYIDLLGIKDYMEVLELYRLSLNEAAESAFVEDKDAADIHEHSNKEGKASTSAGHVNQAPSWDDEEEPSIVASMSKGMAKAIFREMEKMNAKLDGLKSSVDAMNEKLQRSIEVMHQSIEDLRSNLVSTIQMRVEQTLHFGVEKEAGRVPRMVFLTTENLGMRRRALTALFRDVKAVRIELFCEHRKSPHRVDGQRGLCITTLDEGMLKRALPYVNVFLSILTLAAKMGAHAAASAGSMVPDFSKLIRTLTMDGNSLGSS